MQFFFFHVFFDKFVQDLSRFDTNFKAIKAKFDIASMNIEQILKWGMFWHISKIGQLPKLPIPRAQNQH